MKHLPTFSVHDGVITDQGGTRWNWIVWKKDGHHCETDHDNQDEVQSLGAAIDACTEDEKGRFYVHSSDYANQVNVCPFCGVKATMTVSYRTIEGPVVIDNGVATGEKTVS